MKLTRKLLAIILCLIMVMGMAITVSADTEDHKHYISIENNRDGYVYTAYQIFSGDVDSTGILSNVGWGSAIPEEQIDDMMEKLTEIPAFAACTDANSVAAVLATAPNLMDDPMAIAFGDVIGQFATVSSGDSTFDSETGKHTIYNLADGYYLVKNTAVPTGANTTYTRYMLKVVADVNISHKGSFPQVEKKIVEGENRLDVSEASIGEVVQYEIVGTLPENIDYYDTYYYVFTDTLSKGMTYNKDIRVTVDGTDVTKYFYTDDSAYIGTGNKYEGGTSIVAGIEDLLALETLEDYNLDITDKSKVVVSYSVTLNDKAVVGGFEGNPNKVVLEYDNNPNNDGEGGTTPPENPGEPTPPDVHGKTPEDEVTTFTTELTIQKVDGAGKTLTGAEFTLTSDTNVKMNVVTKYEFVEDANGEYWKLKDGTYTKTAPVVDNPETSDVNEDTSSVYESVTTKYIVKSEATVTPVDPAAPYNVTAAVDENGLVSFTGLGAGTYTLSETKTPSGYNTMDDITFTISFGYDNEQQRYEFSSSDRHFAQDVDNTLSAEIENVAGSTLPSTGGAGTTMLYVIGSILFVGAAILLITKKRMANEA